MNTRPRVPDQLTLLQRQIGRLTAAPAPFTELAIAVASLIEHLMESDKRIAELEQKVTALTQSSR